MSGAIRRSQARNLLQEPHIGNTVVRPQTICVLKRSRYKLTLESGSQREEREMHAGNALPPWLWRYTHAYLLINRVATTIKSIETKDTTLIALLSISIMNHT